MAAARPPRKRADIGIRMLDAGARYEITTSSGTRTIICEKETDTATLLEDSEGALWRQQKDRWGHHIPWSERVPVVDGPDPDWHKKVMP